MSSVQITFTGEDRDLLASFQRQQAEILKQQRALLKMGESGKKSGEDTTSSWLSANRTISLVGQTAQFVAQKLEDIIALQAKIKRDADQPAFALDKALRDFLTQQGPQGLTLEQARQAAANVAFDTATSPTAVLRAAKQLQSTGFQNPLADNGAAEAVITFLQSTAQNPEEADIEGTVSAFARQLEASGQDLTAENLLKLGQQTQGLFLQTPLEAPDLIPFSASRGLATQLGISQEEFLAGSAVLKTQQDAAQGATGFGNFLTKLAAPDASGLSALQSIGVKPEDVDFVGESLQQVTTTLANAIDALPDEAKTRALGDLFGREKTNLQSAFTLLDSARGGTLERFVGLSQDTSGFDFGVNQQRGGFAAAQQRLQTQTALESALLVEAGGVPQTLAEDAAALDEVQRQRIRAERLQDANFGTRVGLGVETALDTVGRLEGDVTSQERERARRALDFGQRPFSLEQFEAALRENTRATESNTRGTATVPPAAGLSRSN